MDFEEELKKQIITYFGQDYWDEVETLKTFDQFVAGICNEYLGFTPIPVMFDEIDGMISMLDTNNMLIVVNRKYKEDKVKVLAAIAHELEHYYQILYANSYDTAKAKRWRKELENYINESDIEKNQIQEIEIDAEAFAIVVLETELGLKYENPDEQIQSIIEDYIKLGKLINDN